ncbi:MAG: outer membrane beta-barrel protein [Alphaproteobacteria bacterium]|nr:outer membrane beta-barrel protein [Alphaproteobacteria bacterium]
MKKLVSLVALVALTATAADAAPSYLTRDSDGGYKVTYDYTDRAEAGWWYLGGRLDMNILNWKNESSTDAPDASNLADESFTELLFGGNVFVGHTFNYFWRAELEAGIISEFEDEFGGTTFKMTIPYLMANGYYDFTNGFYVGGGLGIALPKTQLQSPAFNIDDNGSERAVSPMIGLMGGWSYHLDYNLLLDVRYRLAALWGPEHERKFEHTDGNVYKFTNDVGLILDNSISIGLRYEF